MVLLGFFDLLVTLSPQKWEPYVIISQGLDIFDATVKIHNTLITKQFCVLWFFWNLHRICCKYKSCKNFTNDKVCIPAFDVTSINVTGAQFHTLKFINPTEFNATSLERVSGRHVLRTPEKDYWILGYSRYVWNDI